MTSDENENVTLSTDQESRLYVLRTIAALTSTTRIGGRDVPSIEHLMTLADWVMSGEPSTRHIVSPFTTALGELARTDNTEQIIIHAIDEDGLPDMDKLQGQVAFIYDGALVSGRPGRLIPGHGQTWIASDSVTGFVGQDEPQFTGITHWVELPLTIWEMGG